MAEEKQVATASESRFFQYSSCIRKGAFHHIKDVETGALVVITQPTYERLAPLMDEEQQFRISAGDTLPISVLRGLSIKVVK